MGLLEAIMLACFAASWPISIIKALRTQQVAGKSPLFMLLICIGYACGIARKLLTGADWVTALYTFNMLLVAADLALWFHYTRKNKMLLAGRNRLEPPLD